MSNLSAVRNNSGANAVQSPVYAATVTPDLSQGDHCVVGTLTGNVTVANPINIPGAGCDFYVTLTQDATGSRTVTWGAAYAGQAAISGTASKRTTWHFRYDGTTFHCVATNAGY